MFYKYCNEHKYSFYEITGELIISGKGKINNFSETSTDNLTDTEQVKLRYDASREFLDNAYGLAKEVSTYVLNTTNRNIFDCLFVNRGSLN